MQLWEALGNYRGPGPSSLRGSTSTGRAPLHDCQFSFSFSSTVSAASQTSQAEGPPWGAVPGHVPSEPSAARTLSGAIFPRADSPLGAHSPPFPAHYSPPMRSPGAEEPLSLPKETKLFLSRGRSTLDLVFITLVDQHCLLSVPRARSQGSSPVKEKRREALHGPCLLPSPASGTQPGKGLSWRGAVGAPRGVGIVLARTWVRAEPWEGAGHPRGEGLERLGTLPEARGRAGELRGRGVCDRGGAEPGSVAGSHGAPPSPFHGSTLPLTPAVPHAPGAAPRASVQLSPPVCFTLHRTFPGAGTHRPRARASSPGSPPSCGRGPRPGRRPSAAAPPSETDPARPSRATQPLLDSTASDGEEPLL